MNNRKSIFYWSLIIDYFLLFNTLAVCIGVIAFVTPVRCEDAFTRTPRRSGPDLASQWALGTKDIGSVEVIGRISWVQDHPDNSDRRLDMDSGMIVGQFGRGNFRASIGDDTDEDGRFRVSVKMDNGELEIEDGLTGRIYRCGVNDKLDSPMSALIRDRDIFGLEPPTISPRFLSEDEQGLQTWEYPVAGGKTYRVWLAASPLRMLRRDVLNSAGVCITQSRYRNFLGITPRVSLPRNIGVGFPTNVASTLNFSGKLVFDIDASHLSAKPPLPHLESSLRVNRFSRITETLEYTAYADSALLLRLFEQALPSTVGGFTARDAARFAEVTEMIYVKLAVGFPEEAEQLLIRAITLDPTNRKIADLAARSRRLSGDEAGAVAAAERLMRSRQYDIESVRTTGDLLESLSRFDSAAALYETVSRHLFPDEPELKIRLAAIRFSRKDLIGGENICDDLVKWMENTDMEAERKADLSHKIARLLADANIGIYKAKKLVDYALTVDRDNARYLDTLGLVLWRNKNRNAAIVIFKRALALQGEDLEIRRHLERASRSVRPHGRQE